MTVSIQSDFEVLIEREDDRFSDGLYYLEIREGDLVVFSKGGYKTWGTANNAAHQRAFKLREKRGPRKWTEAEQKQNHIRLLASMGGRFD